MEKKNFFVPLAKGLGATRRAAILLLVMMLTMTMQTAWATDKTLSGSESYTAQDGDVLTGSTSGTVTIAADAKITLSDVTISGGIVCAGTAEITLVGTNSVTGFSGYDPNIDAVRYTAGIQVGGSGTTLTIKGDGSLTANGALHSAGIGLSRAWKVDATGGDIVIEGGNITATGDGMGAGIGTGVCFGGDSDRTATLGNITIKGGTVRAIGGTDKNNGNGIGKGFAYVDGHAVVGTITIYDGIDMVDASSISESVTYMHGETDVTDSKTDYFTITEDGSRRVIFPKDDTDYTITIADGIEHGTIACEATTAKLGANVTITATPDQGYIFSRLVVKDAQNNDVTSTGNSFIMPKSNVTVSADFAEDPYNGTCGDGVYYAYDSSTYTLNIFGTGAISNRPWDSYACDIQTVVIGSGVTSIGDHAFNGCYYLESVTVYAPSCSLGEDAFDGCDELEYIYVFSDLVDDYKAAWSDYTSIITGITGGYCGATGHETDVVWVLTGESTNYTLTISGSGAMYDYDDSSECPWNSYAEEIETIVIGNGVTSIGDHAFENCDALTSITIPASVTSIGEYAFSSCNELESVTFAEGSHLTSIGEDAFSDTGLTSITIPASVTSIGVDAFSGCDNLESVTFAEGSHLESIGESAFEGCNILGSITIPASVTSIGEDVFLNCDNLASITVEDGNTVYDSRNGCNAIIEKSTNTLIIGCKNSTIPASVTSIGAWAFYATGLTSIEIPASVTSIGAWAFGVTGLTSIEIPASVTSIGDYAFGCCLNLATVTVCAPSCSLGEDAFADCGSLANIYVFSDLVDNYKAAENWSDYKGKITEMPNPNGKCGDNVRWALTGESTNYTLTICGDGNMDYNDLPERPWEEYAEEIRTVVIESGVESISNNAFQGCSNLATVSFAPCSTLKTIGDGAFQNCHNLTSITIPASVTSIGSDVFQDCENLASMAVEDGNTVYDSRNGCNAIIVKSTNTLIIGCNNSTIPAGVTSIGESAFYATDLTSIEIPAGVTSIGAWAFCVTGLTSIEIPASVTSIGERAFQNCRNLATVTVYAPSCTLGDKAFLNCSKLENIYVFSDLVDDYQGAENWSDYKGKITALPTVTTSYVDADGTLHESVEAVPLNNTMRLLRAGTYVVNSDVNVIGRIECMGDVNIILADGKTMTVNSPNDCINNNAYALTIYGQVLGTGTLNVAGDQCGISTNSGPITISGGTVTATGNNGICSGSGAITISGGTVTATGSDRGIHSDSGPITISSGTVTAIGNNGGISSVSGTITLGLSNATDYIWASSYYFDESGTLGIASGKSLSDGTNTYDNQTASETLVALTNVTLTPPTCSVTANRATTQDTEYWSTFYHPAAGYTADENTTVYQAAVNTTTNNVVLTAVPGREIPADKAVVLKSTQSAITLSRATTTQTLDGNELKGGSTVADGTVPYTLAAKGGTVGFYKFVGAALNPNKAHLEITAPAQSAPAFFGFEENTTAINEHELHKSHELSGAWYSLDGRKLQGKPTQKGLYIVNGKKVIIK